MGPQDWLECLTTELAIVAAWIVLWAEIQREGLADYYRTGGGDWEAAFYYAQGYKDAA